jgi:hypothetical protein
LIFTVLTRKKPACCMVVKYCLSLSEQLSAFMIRAAEAKLKSIFSFFFVFFSLFSLFFAFFAIIFSLRFDLVIFASKRNKAKRNASIFFRFFCFFHFFSLFCPFFSHFFHFYSLHFRFPSIFLLNFRLFYLRFRFGFLVFRIEVNHVKSGFLFASKRNKIFASISNFASEAKVRAHPSCDFRGSSNFSYKNPLSPLI